MMMMTMMVIVMIVMVATISGVACFVEIDNSSGI